LVKIFYKKELNNSYIENAKKNLLKLNDNFNANYERISTLSAFIPISLISFSFTQKFLQDSFNPF